MHAGVSDGEGVNVLGARAAADEACAGRARAPRSPHPTGRVPRSARAARPDTGAQSVLLGDMSPTALLASLFHELRTPVSALATGSELLLDDLDRLNRADLLRIVESMHRGAIWLQRLIENVLYAATVAEGEARIYPRPVNLVELVRDIVPVVEPLLRQRNQTIRVLDRLGGALVEADSRRVGQATINLIANASKYSDASTRIVVTALRRGQAIRLQVADRGPGLPAGTADDLFMAYTRAPEVGFAGIDGAGLGLAIVKSIVDLHGGTVGAARRRGGGSVFWIELPLATPDAAVQATAPGIARRRLA